MNPIYLDHAATTPVDKRVLDAMLPYFTESFGNPSSIYGLGQEAKAAIEEARENLAEFLVAEPNEIIFTSGGSESDNLAIRGVVEAAIFSEDKNSGSFQKKPHVITTAFEHHAVLDTIKELEKNGKIEATYVQPNAQGIVEICEIKDAIKPSTVLVSVMFVNNEIGTVQPIAEIGQILRKENIAREKKMDSRKSTSGAESLPQIYFHTDAVQAAEYFDLDVQKLGVDLLTLTGHKIYGPKGVGALYVKNGTKISRQIIGGSQERRLRAGTENVPAIVGIGKAVKIIEDENLQTKNKKLIKLRDRLIDGIIENIPDSWLNGTRELRSPANVNISFMNVEGEAILLFLNMESISASTGSACNSTSLKPSHVLMSLGLKPEECHGSIRFTLGRDTTEAEIDRVLKVLPAIVKKLRAMSPME